jgi:ketosteroid isomerase-like protein
MSEENVEIVKRFYECWSRGDLWALPELYSDDVEFVWSAKLASLGEGGPFRGREGGIQAMRGIFEAFENLRIHSKRLVDSGDHVIASVIYRAQSKSTGVPVEAGLVHVWTLRGGKVTRLHIFDELDEALEAAGLSEEDARSGSSQ